ncbi:MAG: hypothetical protein F6K65_24690 [Moorea sp. SIO3C2]|nr:hypothetical protein [Moorena sp. SIO3C2]
MGNEKRKKNKSKNFANKNPKSKNKNKNKKEIIRRIDSEVNKKDTSYRTDVVIRQQEKLMKEARTMEEKDSRR